MKRRYEMWIGEQKSGKTHNLRRRIRVLATRRSVTSVFVCDRIGEYSDLGERVRSFAEYVEIAADTIPRIVVFQLGPDADRYDVVFREALELGHCAIVLDEAYEFAPSGSTWRGSARLKQIVFSGRHLPNIDGDECPTHLLIAAQYPRSVDHNLWGQAYTILSAKLRAENSRKWISGNFGDDALRRADALGEYQWTALRGSLPSLGPNRW